MNRTERHISELVDAMDLAEGEQRRHDGVPSLRVGAAEHRGLPMTPEDLLEAYERALLRSEGSDRQEVEIARLKRQILGWLAERRPQRTPGDPMTTATEVDQRLLEAEAALDLQPCLCGFGFECSRCKGLDALYSYANESGGTVPESESQGPTVTGSSPNPPVGATPSPSDSASTSRETP